MMKLSEAIRLGSMIHPQGFGAYAKEHNTEFLGHVVTTEIHTCAYGAGLIASGEEVAALLSNDTDALSPVPEEWVLFVESVVFCPEPHCVHRGDGDQMIFHLNGDQMIFHLNDEHRWSRERIADWVEQMETALSPVAVEELVAA